MQLQISVTWTSWDREIDRFIFHMCFSDAPYFWRPCVMHAQLAHEYEISFNSGHLHMSYQSKKDSSNDSFIPILFPCLTMRGLDSFESPLNEEIIRFVALGVTDYRSHPRTSDHHLLFIPKRSYYPHQSATILAPPVSDQPPRSI